MRKRIKKTAVCSSDNYETSKRLHKEFMREWHEEHIEEIKIISSKIISKKRYFVSVFGELIEITEIEARQVEKSVKVITK